MKGHNSLWSHLEKSLSLADHHIGITHAGDGCSRRITDFDRAAAIELSEELEAEKKAQEESKAEKDSMPELPDPSNMPKVPEPLQTPASLGGLAERAGLDSLGESEVIGNAGVEDQVIESLRERTEEWTEDIDEKEKVIFQILKTKTKLWRRIHNKWMLSGVCQCRFWMVRQ